MMKSAEQWADEKKARVALRKFLEEYPEFISDQDKINERLKNAGSQHNRMALMNSLMMEKFHELNDTLQTFVGDCEHIKRKRNVDKN
jgi:hypothetical protein